MADGRMVAVISGALLLGSLLAVAGVVGSQGLEAGLTTRAEAALADVGVTDVAVAFTGREATLSSDTASAARLQYAELVVEAVDGVRWATVGAPQAASPSTTPSPTPTPTPTPAPTPSPTPVPDEVLASLRATAVMFDADSVALRPDATAAIAGIASTLTAYPDLQVELVGHIAIPVGTEADAIAFSERRAAAVADELVRLGVDRARLTVTGVGTADAVGDNATASGAASNRRVTIEIEEDS